MIFGDIIRYIVVNFHPTNDQLKADLAKRWEIINHLLVSTRDLLALSYAVQSLTYDWFFYTR
jgi:hypothetical protein